MNENLREAERQLYASESRFAALTMATGQIVWTMPADGVVDDMPLWRAFTGQSDDAVKGWGWLDAIHPDDQAQTHLLWRQTIGQPNRFETEYRVCRADGHYRTMLTRVVPVFDAQGGLQEWVGSSTDITEQKQLALRTQQALDVVLAMAAVVVTPPEDAAITVATSDAKPAWLVNQGVAKELADLTCHLLGCQRVGITACDADLREYPIVAVGFKPDDEQCWMRHHTLPLGNHLDPLLLAQLQQRNAIVVDSATAAWQDPASFGASDVLIAPISIGKELAGLIALDYGGAVHTYTAEEIALAQAVARLFALVSERDRLVREREAAYSKLVALQDLNQRMDEFLGIVSHELRTPLTAMKASIQLSERRIQALLQGSDTLPEVYSKKLVQTYDLLNRSDRQANRLTRLIGDLLDTSRIQLGKIEFHIAPCDINTVVRDVVEEHRQVWTERAITLTVLEQSDMARSLLADAERIEQVVTNLLANAVKYSPAEAPIAVALDLEPEQVRLRVRDHGPGIHISEQGKIWERFYRIPNTHELNGTGIGFGLGLFIAQQIIAQHGGDIGVESALGEGATFWFTLPLATV